MKLANITEVLMVLAKFYYSMTILLQQQGIIYVINEIHTG